MRYLLVGIFGILGTCSFICQGTVLDQERTKGPNTVFESSCHLLLLCFRVRATVRIRVRLRVWVRVEARVRVSGNTFLVKRPFGQSLSTFQFSPQLIFNIGQVNLIYWLNLTNGKIVSRISSVGIISFDCIFYQRVLRKLKNLKNIEEYWNIEKNIEKYWKKRNWRITIA